MRLKPLQAVLLTAAEEGRVTYYAGSRDRKYPARFSIFKTQDKTQEDFERHVHRGVFGALLENRLLDERCAVSAAGLRALDEHGKGKRSK